MSKIANLGAGLRGGYMAGRQAKERKTREDKQDKLYDAILGKMMGAQKTEENATTPAPANPLTPTNSAPVTAGSNADPMKKPAAPVTYDEFGNAVTAMRNGGMVMPRADRMSWQRQSFKK